MAVNYIRGGSLSDDQLQTGIESGELQAWRVSPDGEQWFKQSHFPEIHGVPRDSLKYIATDSLTSAEQVELDEVGSVYLDGRGLYQSWNKDGSGRAWLKRVDAIAAEAAEMEYEAEADDEGLEVDDEPSVIQRILTDPENEGMLDAAREYLDEYFDD